MKSEQLDQLATALSGAQKEMPAVPMNAVNPFLKNKYADLAEMIRVASPVLTKHGLSISQHPVSQEGTIGVTTTLLHTSGQWIEDTISLPLGEKAGITLAQAAGAIITYLRRYSYGAIVGLATDEDTDGNAPAKHHEQPEKPYEAEPVKPVIPTNGTRPYSPIALKARILTMADSFTGSTCKENDKTSVRLNLQSMTGGEEQYHAVLNWLIGTPHINEATPEKVLALKKWIHVTKQTDDTWLPDQLSVQEARAAYDAALMAIGQESLLESSGAGSPA